MYQTLIGQGVRLLKPKGHFLFEIGYGQKERIQSLCSRFKELQLLRIREDQRGIPRTFVLQKM